MTLYSQQLLEKAKDYWSMGLNIPIDLYSQLTREGMDVVKLEQIYLLEQND